MKIKKQIRITYLVDLQTDIIEQRIEEGIETIATIKKEIAKRGVLASTGIIWDYEVESVEDIEEK